jgi:hypothetical protein
MIADPSSLACPGRVPGHSPGIPLMAVGTVRQGTPPRDPGEPAPAAPQVTAPGPLVYLRDAGEHGVRHRRALPVAGVGRYRIAQEYKAWHASDQSARRWRAASRRRR